MTRMWLLPTGWLCDDHLLGEHSEMHQAAGTIANHEHGLAVMEGHVKDDAPDDVATRLIEQRHAELAMEMGTRGMDHDSPLQDFEDPGIGELDGDDVRTNAVDLAARCPGCAHRMAVDGHYEYRLGSKARFADRVASE